MLKLILTQMYTAWFGLFYEEWYNARAPRNLHCSLPHSILGELYILPSHKMPVYWHQHV